MNAPTTRLVLDLNDLELAQLHHLVCTAPAAPIAGLVQKVLRSMPVDLPIPYPDPSPQLPQSLRDAEELRYMAQSVFLRRQAG